MFFDLYFIYGYTYNMHIKAAEERGLLLLLFNIILTKKENNIFFNKNFTHQYISLFFNSIKTEAIT